MDELRQLCSDLGWVRPRTYIQSGNIVFRADRGAHELEEALERVVFDRLGMSVPTIVRDREEWRLYLEGNPFPTASAERPHLVMLAFSKESPLPDAAMELAERARNGERVERVGEAIWIDFLESAGRSKITPGLLDRIIGSVVTTRNWRTVLELDSMLDLSDRS